MKNISGELNTGISSKWLHAIEARSYRNLAGGLVGQMMGFMRPNEPRKCSPPFKLVIISRQGTVVFECRTSKDGKVRPLGLVRRIRNSHFPATALLTDRTLVTRTFLIEKEVSANDKN